MVKDVSDEVWKLGKLNHVAIAVNDLGNLNCLWIVNWCTHEV